MAHTPNSRLTAGRRWRRLCVVLLAGAGLVAGVGAASGRTAPVAGGDLVADRPLGVVGGPWTGLTPIRARLLRSGAPRGRTVLGVRRFRGSSYGVATRVRLKTVASGTRLRASVVVRAASRQAVGRPITLMVVQRTRASVVARVARSVRLTRSWRPLAVTIRVHPGGASLGLRLAQSRARRGAAFEADRAAVATTPTPLARPSTPEHDAEAAPSDLAVGINTHLLRAADADRRSILALAGGLVVRESISWPGEDMTGPDGWPLIDPFVADVEEAGARLLPVLELGLRAAPDAAELAGYSRWVRAFCDRYRPPLIEIDNEPWNTGEWAATAPEYAAQVRAATDALEGAPCRALVSADLYTSDGREWAGPLLASAPELWSRPAIAGWSVHAYTAPYAPETSWLPERWSFHRHQRVLEHADRYADAKPAYLTELGWRTEGPQAVAEESRAAFIDRALAMADDDSRVALAAVYKLHPSPTDSADERGFAITRSDSTPMPALAVVRRRIP